MKNLEILTGSKVLSKKEQQAVKGGFSGSFCSGEEPACPEGQHCEGIFCVPDNPNNGDPGGGPGDDHGLP